MRFHSLRWQLSLTYAGIAFLTALLLNLLLLGALRAYYERQELAYLSDNATFITPNLVRLIGEGVPPGALAAQIKVLSFLAQTRLRLFDVRQAVVADSGPPAQAQLEIVVVPQTSNLEAFLSRDQPATPEGQAETSYAAYLAFRSDTLSEAPIASPAPIATEAPIAPPGPIAPETSVTVIPSRGRPDRPMFLTLSELPRPNSWYGLGLSPDASRTSARAEARVIFPLSTVDSNDRTRMVGYVEMSEGPAFGRQVLATVAQLGGLTGLAAIVLAAGTGWLVSRRLSRPVMALTAATARMADGDLSVRAEVRQADELGLLATAFNYMAERLEGLVNTLRRFVADAAHELNTPLAILHTDLELLIASGPDPRQRQLADRILIQVQRLEALVSGLLELSRLDAAPEAQPTVALDLAALARESAERYASQAEQAGLIFELEVGEDPPVIVLANREQIAQALGNLLDNAIKFTPAGGRVRLVLSQAGGWAELRVEDTGIGIPAEDLPELFQRFHRGRNSAAYPGNGLGLAIVKRVVERHSGRIQASSPGEGACFRVWLPVATGAPAEVGSL